MDQATEAREKTIPLQTQMPDLVRGDAGQGKVSC